MQLRIRFPDRSSREQSLAAADLQSAIAAEVDRASVEREREDTQDPGTILTIILGAPAVVGAVSAIAAWLIRKNQGSITIEDEHGKVVVKNMESKDMPAAIKAIEGLHTKN